MQRGPGLGGPVDVDAGFQQQPADPARTHTRCPSALTHLTPITTQGAAVATGYGDKRITKLLL
jgi:hypothetical protein